MSIDRLIEQLKILIEMALEDQLLNPNIIYDKKARNLLYKLIILQKVKKGEIVLPDRLAVKYKEYKKLYRDEIKAFDFIMNLYNSESKETSVVAKSFVYLEDGKSNMDFLVDNPFSVLYFEDKVRGIQFTGRRDGKVVVIYDTDNCVPISYTLSDYSDLRKKDPKEFKWTPIGPSQPVISRGVRAVVGKGSFKTMNLSLEELNKRLRNKIEEEKYQTISVNPNLSWILRSDTNFTADALKIVNVKLPNYVNVFRLKLSGAVWDAGVWIDGIWAGGKWNHGKWYGGYDTKMSYHGEDDSPDKWKKKNPLQDIGRSSLGQGE